jgi:hypothetical protein
MSDEKFTVGHYASHGDNPHIGSSLDDTLREFGILKEVEVAAAARLNVVSPILPALSADPVLEKAIGKYQSVVVIGYDNNGELQAAASMNLRGHEILWLIESFKTRLLNGEYGGDV